MESILLRDLYKDKCALALTLADQEITVSGWVRSVRDSKSLGFIVLHDGTCFQTLQIVYESSGVRSYTDATVSLEGDEAFRAVSRLAAGSAVVVTGRLVLTPEAKQPFELHASDVILEGRLYAGLSSSEKTSFDGISADRGSSASPYQHLSGCFPRSLSGCLCNPPVFPGPGFCLCAYSSDHRQRLRGRR